MEIQKIPLIGGSQQRAERLVPTIPVMSPRLPSGDRLLPYLRRIDASRIYTNFGPLVLELEVRLRDHLSLPEGGFVSASSGTAALVAAILASTGRARPQRPLALMPAYTFVATAVAAEQCGFQPCLADVDPQSWMLDPEQLLAHPMLDQIGMVLPVSPYGKGVAQAPWLAFRERTGIPVVIDGAASFEAVSEEPASCLGEIPVI
ncbi:MAG TPA: DegT/DnrJ/EryC1/StrS family aminotransferase, partial [Devosia sp.]|nr:DegT/DnrJ/EryC1/StrS family aminotransferase [Devosia sp.]